MILWSSSGAEVESFGSVTFELPAECDAWHRVAVEDMVDSSEEEEKAGDAVGSFLRATARKKIKENNGTTSKQRKVAPGKVIALSTFNFHHVV